MGADTIARAAKRLPMVPRRRPAALRAESRKFWIGVTCAAVLHAALILGIARSSDRRIGEPEGSSTGISVELVDAADLLSKSRRSPPRTHRRPAGQHCRRHPACRGALAAARCRAANRRRSPNRAGKAKLALAADPTEEREHSAGKTQTKRVAGAKPRRCNSTCLNAVYAPGRSAAATRPPGVTRSGENDEFGRGVIRALRETMPAPRGMLAG